MKNEPDLTKPVLELKNVSCSHTPSCQLSGISMAFYPGEIHTVIGDKNSGISGLAGIIGGTVPAHAVSGELLYRDKPLRLKKAGESQRMGIQMVYPGTQAVSKLSVAENIFLGCEKSSRGIISWDETWLETIAILKQMDWPVCAETRVSQLQPQDLLLLNMARAFRSSTTVAVLDETFMSSPEVEQNEGRFLGLIRRLRDRAVAVVTLHHRMDHVFDSADRVSVLKNGRLVYHEAVTEASMDHVILALSGQEPHRPKDAIPKDFLTRYSITPREEQVLKLLLRGCSAKQMSDELFISLATVKTHIYNIYQKTGVSNRLALAACCQG